MDQEVSRGVLLYIGPICFERGYSRTWGAAKSFSVPSGVCLTALKGPLNPKP